MEAEPARRAKDMLGDQQCDPHSLTSDEISDELKVLLRHLPVRNQVAIELPLVDEIVQSARVRIHRRRVLLLALLSICIAVGMMILGAWA